MRSGTIPILYLARLRAEAPIAYVPQLGGTVMARHDDIMVSEKLIEVFSSDQPGGLMTRLMGHNMMRKDGPAHAAERKVIFASLAPRAVKAHWTARFRTHAERLLADLAPRRAADLFDAFARPFSGECLKDITGLTNVRFDEIDAWSQAMIDGIANYAGKPEIEARCHAATAAIDAAIDEVAPALRGAPDLSLLSAMLAAEMPMQSVRANIRLAISGGQNEPRDVVAGATWALLTHPKQLAQALSGQVPWLNVFEEFARWISPIGMSPRRVARPWTLHGVDFSPDDRVFFLFGSANRDEAQFAEPDRFDIARDTAKSIAFGAGPHFCVGAWASRSMVADAALPAVFRHLRGLRLDAAEPVRIGGWAFRGVLNLPVVWDGGGKL